MRPAGRYLPLASVTALPDASSSPVPKHRRCARSTRVVAFHPDFAGAECIGSVSPRRTNRAAEPREGTTRQPRSLRRRGAATPKRPPQRPPRDPLRPRLAVLRSSLLVAPGSDGRPGACPDRSAAVYPRRPSTTCWSLPTLSLLSPRFQTPVARPFPSIGAAHDRRGWLHSVQISQVRSASGASRSGEPTGQQSLEKGPPGSLARCGAEGQPPRKDLRSARPGIHCDPGWPSFDHHSSSHQVATVGLGRVQIDQRRQILGGPLAGRYLPSRFCHRASRRQ